MSRSFIFSLNFGHPVEVPDSKVGDMRRQREILSRTLLTLKERL